MQDRSGGVELIAERDIEWRDGRRWATSREPWLGFADKSLFPAGAAVEIVYRASIYDDPVRPLLRFWRGPESIDRLLPGPVAGAGRWVGHTPSGVTGVSISPVAQEGRFDFRVESVRRVSAARVLARSLRQSPGDAVGAIACRAIGYEPEYARNLGWAVGFTPLTDYARWRDARIRPLEPEGLDAPRTDWSQAPLILAVIEDGRHTARTCASLQAQTYGRWRAASSNGPAGDPRFVSTLDALTADRPTLVLRLAAGDELAPHAFACLIEHAARHPGQTWIYADEERREATGGVTPDFKPDWSPLLQAAAPYVGRMNAARTYTAADATALAARAALSPPIDADPDAVGHIRRALLRVGPAPTVTPPVVATPVRTSALRVAIVIPSKDRLSLLKPCVESLFAVEAGAAFETIVVDNGSVEPATRDWYRELAARQSPVRILDAPGAFNFSWLCNQGAKAASADATALLFLNNDTEARTPGWLARLAARALEPDIGAVGAKLLFPAGDVQHVDLVLGLQGDAGLRDRCTKADAPGLFQRNLVAHECSGVAAACLAVERAKFNAVGGFDENLRIELNDIDLCLRLAQRGWRCVSDPAITLLHREGASRGGASFQRLTRHAGDRAAFFARWGRIDRDDRYYHPGLSLERLTPALA